ncbi:MAG: hypothetical protein A2328_01935 [Bdellovibrionales bacterium RIFOXYB2_FULL_36_6]|nr:MAG: hypothetical protein A2328_01935 [Bdellovibrionales bacterium RIFOXYB2_FULL_36_6]OGZ23298.1 MAG: hypothetical protein A2981_02580 [Candidatus Nealsonbacteria bacterium RIFCSPLOWO2_01_FULL_38_120]
MGKSILEIKRKVIFILKSHDVKKAAVFGSFARGEETEKSDVDILIEFKNANNKSLLDLVGLKIDLEEALSKKVDIVEYPAIKPIIRSRILEEQISIL